MKFLITLCFLEVLLQLGYTDIECFLDEVEGKTPMHDIFNMNICTPSVFEDQRQILKTCKIDDKVNLDDLEKLSREMCTENTDFSKVFEASFVCLNFEGRLNPCLPYIDPLKSSKNRVIELCRKRTKWYKCLINEVAKPCGENGLIVMNRTTKSIDSYLQGICYLVARAASSNVYLWNILPCVVFALIVWV